MTAKQEIEKYLKQKKGKRYIAEKFGMSPVAFNEYFHSIMGQTTKETGKLTVTKGPQITVQARTFTEDIKKGTAELTAEVKREIHNLEELIEYTKIDISVWNIDKYVQNYWGNEDHPHWQVKAFLSKKKVDNSFILQKELLLKEIREQKPAKAWNIRHGKKKGLLYELSIPDIHIGKLAWNPESGNDYDIDIAISRYKDAIKELLSRVNLEQIGRIHLPLGNDGLHVDNAENLTTAGTPQDTDGRFPKIVKAAKKLFIEVIDELKLIAPVDVTIIRGNHDSTSMFMLGEILEAWYHNDYNVNVNNDPKFRKYYQFGLNSFLFTHGDKEKQSDLGIIFATEQPKLWGDTKFRFAKLGHLHKSKKTEFISVDTHNGFQVEILPSLSGTDEWHYSKGYLALKQAKAFLYDLDKGEIGNFTTTIINDK